MINAIYSIYKPTVSNPGLKSGNHTPNLPLQFIQKTLYNLMGY